MWETWVWSLGWEDPLEKGTHSSVLAWRIGMDWHGLYSPWGCKELDNWVTFTSLHTLWSAFTILSIFYSYKKFVLKLSFSPGFVINQLVTHACWYNRFLSYEVVFICLTWNVLVSLIWKISLHTSATKHVSTLSLKLHSNGTSHRNHCLHASVLSFAIMMSVGVPRSAPPFHHELLDLFSSHPCALMVLLKCWVGGWTEEWEQEGSKSRDTVWL